jgi:hypothetical protein
MGAKFTTKTESPIVSMYTVASGIWALNAIRPFGKQVQSELVKIMLSFELLFLKSDLTFIPHIFWI